MGIFDRFRQRGTRGRGVRKKQPYQRGIREQTKEIRTDPNPYPHSPTPSNVSSQGPQHSPNPTVVRPVVDPVQRQAPTPPPASEGTEGKTILVNSPAVFTSVVGVLVAIEGEFEGEIYKLRDGENKIGRTDECGVQLPSRHISRPHAVLIHKDGMFAVKPLKPESPVYVNDERVEGVAQLRDHDSLKLGRTTLRLLSLA